MNALSFPYRRPLHALFAVLLLTVPFAFAACGGGGEASDEAYVKSVCNAGKKFGEDVQKLLVSPDASDEDKMASEFNKLLKRFVDDVRKANPPEDVEQGHNSLVSSLEAAVRIIELDGIEGLYNFEEPEITLSPEVSARLARVAGDTVECAEAGDLF